MYFAKLSLKIYHLLKLQIKKYYILKNLSKLLMIILMKKIQFKFK